MGSQVEVEVSGCFCLQYKSSYATSFHPHFFTPFRSTKLLKQMSNCCAFCVFCCLSHCICFPFHLGGGPFCFRLFWFIDFARSRISVKYPAPCPETPSLGSSIDLQSSHRATWYVLTSVPKESGVPKVGVQHMCLLNFEISWKIMQSRVMSWPSQNYSMKLWLLKVYLKWLCLDHWA